MIHCEAKRDDIEVTMKGTGADIAFEFLAIIGTLYEDLLKDHTREDARKAMTALLEDGMNAEEAARRSKNG